MPFRAMNTVSDRVIDVNAAVVDERQAGAHLTHVGKDAVLVVVELPEAGQRSERDIEFSAGRLARVARRPQHFPNLEAGLHGCQARGPVHALDLAFRYPGRHESFQPPELRKNVFECLTDAGRVGAPGGQPKGRTHRELRLLDEAGPGCRPRRGTRGVRWRLCAAARRQDDDSRGTP